MNSTYRDLLGRLLIRLREEVLEAEINLELHNAIRQPLAQLVQGSYTCSVDGDGTEVFENLDVTVRVPCTGVTWHRPPVVPTGPMSVPSLQLQVVPLIRSLLEGTPRPTGVHADADALLNTLLQSLTD